MNVWELDEAAYQATWSLREKLEFWLQYAILAPSAHNNQPWKVELTENGIVVKPDMELVSSGTPRLTVISLGAFVENFVETCEHFGYTATVAAFPGWVKLKDLAIAVTVAEGAPESTLPFSGITKRHTNRGLYDPQALSEETRTQLKTAQPEPGTSLHYLADTEPRHQVADMAAKGMRIAVTLPPLRRELARFVHWKRENSDIGMYVESMVREPAEAETGNEFILKKIDIPGEAKFTAEKFATAPLHVVVSTEADDAVAWFAAGRTLQRLLNRAAELGLAHDIAAAPTEVPPFLPRMRHLLHTTERPQITLRLGKPLDPSFTHPSPRRPVSSILTG